MILDPFDAAQKFVGGLIHEKHLQDWFRLGASIIATAFVSFFGTFGISLEAQVQLGVPPMMGTMLSLAHASLLMALMVLALWKQSPLTKGIPILIPGRIVQAAQQQLQKDGTELDPNLRK